MSTWKKMAEAFGRARELHPNKNPMKSRYLEDGTLEQAGSPLDDAQFAPSRRDPAVEEAYLRGIEQGRKINRAIDNVSISRGGSTPEERETWRHWGEARLTDENLERNALDDWSKAFDRRKQEDAEAFKKQLWECVDELKAEGVSAQDILNRLKGNN